MSVPEIQEELREDYNIKLSEDCIEDHIGRYQAILAARQRDPMMLKKAYERRIHGRQHAGVRIVQEGPGLLLALDAHHAHRQAFTEDELLPYLGAKPTERELEAVERRKLMRRVTSRKGRPGLSLLP